MKANDIILRIIQLRPSLTTFHVAKLAYLFDLACVQLFGEPRSGIHYKWWHYGPYGEDIDRAIGDLENKGKIKVEDYTTMKMRNSRLHSAVSSRKPKLTSDEEQLIEHVVKRFGFMTTAELKNFVYSTPPMIDAQKKHAKYDSLNLYYRGDVPDAFFNTETVRALLGRERKSSLKYVSAEEVLAKIGA